MWRTQVSNSDNAHKLIVVPDNKANWVNMSMSPKEMEFMQFQKYLITIICNNFTISPEEVHFTGETGYQASQSKTSRQYEKEYSMSKGLKPLLVKVQEWINRYLMYPLTDAKYKFIFTGLETNSLFALSDAVRDLSQTALTVNEVRAILRYPPRPEGDMILNQLASQEVQNLGLAFGGVDPHKVQAGVSDEQLGMNLGEGGNSASAEASVASKSPDKKKEKKQASDARKNPGKEKIRKSLDLF